MLDINIIIFKMWLCTFQWLRRIWRRREAN